MLVNADRKGPKDMMDLANKANAYKGLLDAKSRHDAGPTPETQAAVDDAFDHFATLHGGDAGDMQTTRAYIEAMLAKGKAH